MGKAKTTPLKFIPGPCNSFVVGETSPTGLTWKELAERRHQLILENFRRWGIENPSLEMMYCKGIGYIKSKIKKENGDSQFDLEFFHPKPFPKSTTGEHYGRVSDVRNVSNYSLFDNIEDDGHSQV